MANKLCYYLRRTGARDVHVSMEQVIELIGNEKAEELCVFTIAKQEIRSTRVGPRSAIPPNKRVSNVGLSQFNRRNLLAAIEEAQGADFQKDGTEPAQELKDTAEFALFPKKKQQELLQRGYGQTAVS